MGGRRRRLAQAPPPPDGRRTSPSWTTGIRGSSRASANIGDHIQSIAALGHLVRHRGVRLHGAPELVGLLDRLGERTRPSATDDVEADIEVMTVHRDASMYQPIPEDTWVLCFGWYMHALFELRHGFPLHRNLRPIFVSFHCNKRNLLTPDAIEYLKRYGPVGCRDWTTVYLLLSCGVPAFFSGCVTTTIGTLFPPPAVPPDGPLAYVDMPDEEVPAGAVVYKHSEPAVRRRSFVTNVGKALELLERYRSEHARCRDLAAALLPAAAVDRRADVEFRPQNRSDVRFDGLIGISDEQFDAIRAGLLDEARAGPPRDPRRPARGRGLRALACDQRRRRRRSGAARERPLGLPPVAADVEEKRGGARDDGGR